MEALTGIILACFLVGLYCFVRIMKGMAKLKEQNDRIYEDTYTKENTYPVRLEDKEMDRFQE